MLIVVLLGRLEVTTFEDYSIENGSLTVMPYSFKQVLNNTITVLKLQEFCGQ
jgi:hypothetical protein